MVLICISLISDVEHIFMCLLIILWRNVYSSPLTILKIKVFVFLLLTYCSFIKNLKVNPSTFFFFFFFFKIALNTQGPSCFHINVRFSLSISTHKPPGILIEITSNLQINLVRADNYIDSPNPWIWDISPFI